MQTKTQHKFQKGVVTTKTYSKIMLIVLLLFCLMGRTAAVPEPATMLLLGTGLLCFAGLGSKTFY